MSAENGQMLSEILAGDKSGVERRRLEEALCGGRNVLKARLDRGVAREEFEKGQHLLAAYEAALRGLERVWTQRHGTD